MAVSASVPKIIAALVAVLGVASTARAADVGVGNRARPALERVGVPEQGKPGHLAAAADLGAGVTESLADGDSLHKRFAGSAALGVDVLPQLNIAALMSGRYDQHGKDAEGKDDGFLFQSELSARLSLKLNESWGFGVEATAWLPGGPDIGTSFSAISTDGRLLVARQSERAVFGTFAGFRLDRSANAAKDAAQLRFGDRSALGASDYNAILVGVGGGYQVGKTLLFGEVSAQLLLGSPKMSASPIWVTLGARPALSQSLALEFGVDVLASARPDVSSTEHLMPIEPRAMLHIGLRWRTVDPPPPVITNEQHEDKPVDETKKPPVAAPSKVLLTLVDDRGQPLRRAKVVLKQGDAEVTLAEAEAEPGKYQLEGATPGPAHLHIEADGYQPIERDIQVGPGEVKVDVKAEAALPAGQVRGLVRSFKGKPLAARVHVEPSGAEAKTDAQGFFQIDVPPGEYEVVIESPGFEPQRRKAKVDEHGVVIVNADLVQKK